MNRQKKIASDSENTIRNVYRGLIPIVILVSGIGLLALRIQGWSSILGLPLTVIGAVLLIYEYDYFISSKVGPLPRKAFACDVCGRATNKLKKVKSKDICIYCEWEMKRISTNKPSN